MSLPELVRKKAEQLFSGYCSGYESGSRRTDLLLNYSWEEDHLTLWGNEGLCGYEEVLIPIAQFRYHDLLGQWTLHYFGDDGRWRLYLNSGPTLDLEKLLEHLEADPLRVFWP